VRTLVQRSVHGAIVVVLVGVLAGCGAADVDETTRDEQGVVTDGGELGVQKLRVGDCLDLGNTATQEEGEVEAFQAIPCDEPHQGEVYLSQEDAFREATWPGRTTVEDKADELCLGAFEGYVGVAYDETDLDLVALSPTEDSWSLGDRGVSCLVIRPTEDGKDVEQVTGSLKGKG
jgi:Septum formation